MYPAAGLSLAREIVPPTTSNRPNRHRALRRDTQRPRLIRGMMARPLLGRLRGQQSSSEPRQRCQQGGLSKPKIPTVAQDIPILVRRVVHTMVPRTCLMFVPNRPVIVDVQSPRDREDPISKYAHCPPSWSSIRGVCGEGSRSVTPPSGCDMTASPLGWCLGSAWQYRRRDMSPVLVMCR